MIPNCYAKKGNNVLITTNLLHSRTHLKYDLDSVNLETGYMLGMQGKILPIESANGDRISILCEKVNRSFTFSREDVFLPKIKKRKLKKVTFDPKQLCF
jgi:hypothetical protein